MQRILHVLLLFSVVSACSAFSLLFAHKGQTTTRRVVSCQSSWQSHISIHPDSETAIQELIDKVELSRLSSSSSSSDTNLPGSGLAFLFVGSFHAAKFEKIVQIAAASELSSYTTIVSIVSGGVVGNDIEMDEPSKPCLAILAGRNVGKFQTFTYNELNNPPSVAELRKRRHEFQNVLLFADPWSPLQTLLDVFADKVIVAGGISFPTGTGPTVALDNQALPQGSLVGISFESMCLQVVVAQGCRPIGQTHLITKAKGSMILELDGKPATRVLEHFLASVRKSAEQKTISSGLVCGILDPNNNAPDQKYYYTDNFLVRQIVGFVPDQGGIVIASGGSSLLHARLRFLVRDNIAAEHEWDLLRQRTIAERSFVSVGGVMDDDEDHTITQPVAALQISCVARGQRFFGGPNVDLSYTKTIADDEKLPVCGFYANGEIGPVGIAGISSSGATTHLHGFTTVVALLCDKITNVKPVSSSTVDELSGAWD